VVNLIACRYDKAFYCFQSLFDRVSLFAIFNLNGLLELINTVGILLEVKTELVCINDCVATLNYECKAVDIFLCYITLDCLCDVNVTGLNDLLVSIRINNGCRLVSVITYTIKCSCLSCVDSTTVYRIACGNCETFFCLKCFFNCVSLCGVFNLYKLLEFIITVLILLEVFAKLVCTDNYIAILNCE